MATPVLATKLYLPPPRPQRVPRARLLEQLNAGLRLGRTLTFISAPAGFGKTTLLSAWVCQLGDGLPPQPEGAPVAQPPARVAWLSLDEQDNDLTRFLTYLIAALQTVEPGLGAEALALLEARPPQPPEAVLTALLNAVAGLAQPVVLVLDDYHLIELRPIHAAVTFLLDHLPRQLHLAIAGRADPLLPLARLRARGQLTELRAADLRFRPDEAAGFLNQVMGLTLSPDDIAALETRTEGWIAGLQMAALSLQGRDDIGGFIQAFAGSHRYIIDYLVEEVLQRQPEAVRSFLLQTSILDRLSGPLCDAVTGQADDSERLPALERTNLFVVPLDDQRRWYRYHHLFAEVLRAQLREAQPQNVPALHQRASAWYEQHDLPVEAVRHALAAADFDRAATLVEQAWPAVARSRQDAVLRGWLRALPEAHVRRRPVLSVLYAGALLLAGELDSVEPRLRDAEQWLEAAASASTAPASEPSSVDDPALLTLPAQIAIYRAALAQARGDSASTAHFARQALDRVQPGDHLGRGGAAGFLGLALWAGGDVEAAYTTFAEAVASLRLAGNTAEVISSAVVLADMRVAHGRLRDAHRILEEAQPPARDQSERAPLPTADLLVAQSELHLELNELETAAQLLERARALGERASLSENRYRWYAALGRLRAAHGDPDGALARLSEAERLYLRGFYPNVRPVPAMRARVLIAHGRLSEAEGWARAQGLTAQDEPAFLREYEHLTLARLLLAQHRAGQHPDALRQATDLLDRLLPAAEAGGRTGSVSEILMLQALAHAAQGNVPRALPPLARALAQAEPEGYTRLFVDEGPPMAALLQTAAQRGPATPAVQRLLGAFGQSAPPAVSPPAVPAHPPLIEPLSEREREVLRLLRTELTGPEIARQLMVSLNTFHTHTKNIYSKLGVKNRQAAVIRADALKLT